MKGNKILKPIKIQASKSILNRLMIIATMMDEPLKFRNFSNCNDVKTISDNLFKLGYDIIERGDFLTISKTHNPLNDIHLFIDDSATAARLLLARLSVWEDLNSVIDASPQLKKRPMKSLISTLHKMGAEISGESFPFIIKGNKLEGNSIKLNANVSSQFISALMLIAPKLKTDLKIELQNEIVSKKYIEMTAKIMQNFGVNVTIDDHRIEIPSRQKYEQKEIYNVEPDYSSAAYFWAIGANSQEWVTTEPITKKSLQADFVFLEILKKMGAEIKIQNEMIWVRKNELHGITIDMKNMPDQVPTLAVLAVLADSPTEIRNINHLRFKESDRIKSLMIELEKLNVKIQFKNDELKIFPAKQLNTTKILSSHNDHRIAMSLSVLQFYHPKIKIDDLECIKKSNPEFIRMLADLRVSS